MKLSKETKAYKNKLVYIREYNKKNGKEYMLRLKKNEDKDIIDFLESKENKNGYLKELIRNDMNRI